MGFPGFRQVTAGFVLSSTILLAAAGGVSAQGSPANLEANIFEGSCAELAELPLQSLSQVTPNDPNIGGSFSGARTATGVLTSESEPRISLNALLSNPHAIVIGDPAAPVDCGDIGGFTRGIVNNDDIDIGLAPVGDSGIFGVAQLEGDGDETEIDLDVVAPFTS